MLPSRSDALPILVVDDDDQMRKTISDLLRFKGYTPFGAPTAQGGLDAVTRMELPPAIALVDLRLPDMDGIELVSRLRAISELTEVVILTGNASLDSAVRALREQSYDYLVKPVQPEYLLNSMDRAAERWRRKSAEAAMRRSQEQLRRVFDHVRDGLFITNEAGRIVDANPAACDVVGVDIHVIREHTIDAVLGPPVTAPRDPGGSAEHHVRGANGEAIIVDVQSTTFAPGMFVHAVRDLTERRQLEAELHQSRKMDAIGRLAGGVAHDINNVLTAITCYSELLLESVQPNDVRHEDVLEIRRAAQRAASLTEHLLAFSRKQALRPQVLDLNAVVAGIERMISRLIGEDIAVEVSGDPRLWPVYADPGQLDQVIVNLAVNARDAMPDGGAMAITSTNVTLNKPLVHRHGTIEPGEYVVLRVTDHGSGMTEEVQEHLFEPFYTTKAHGRGTGLGLATVYGIVRQSHGRIEVTSTPGGGTTIAVYLPRARHGVVADVMRQDVPTQGTRGGNESILLAEDDEALRALMARLLQDIGYRVLIASDGAEALALAEHHSDQLHLLIVDVVMPEMNGRELAERVTAMNPAVKALFISGYTDDRLVLRGVSDLGSSFLQKPFTKQMLSLKVREVLDTPVLTG